MLRTQVDFLLGLNTIIQHLRLRVCRAKNHGNQTRFKTTVDKCVMDDVRFEDEGVITCRAENVFEVQETKVELTVLGEWVIFTVFF